MGNKIFDHDLTVSELIEVLKEYEDNGKGNYRVCCYYCGADMFIIDDEHKLLEIGQ